MRGCSLRNPSLQQPQKSPTCHSRPQASSGPHPQPSVLQGLGCCPSPGPGPERGPSPPDALRVWHSGHRAPSPQAGQGGGGQGAGQSEGAVCSPRPAQSSVMSWQCRGGGGRAVFLESWSWREGDKARLAAAPWSCGPASYSGNFCFCGVSAGCGTPEAPATSASRECGLGKAACLSSSPAWGRPGGKGTVRGDLRDNEAPGPGRV